MSELIPEISNIQSIAERYSCIFCDVWGVLHNGVSAYSSAVKALTQLKSKGKIIVLITNSPRPAEDVQQQLLSFNISPQAYNFIVTSGDATRFLIHAAPRKIFHIGPDRDLPLFAGLNVELVEEWEAQAVVCTGLFDEEIETPDGYSDLLMRLRARNLVFVCANPDIIVERGDALLWCAGALARKYSEMGGRVEIAGKPHQAIYELALKKAREVKPDLGKDILAIGDGLLTDIKGAQQFGVDSLLIADGIHAADYTLAGKFNKPLLEKFIADVGYKPIAFMRALK